MKCKSGSSFVQIQEIGDDHAKSALFRVFGCPRISKAVNSA